MKKPILIEIIIWTIILTIIFTVGIFVYSKIFVEPNIYNIEFKDIDGITKGSPVRFMGINVGYVRQLKTNDRKVNVQIIITKKDMKIPQGTAARVEFYGLGGSKSIELMPPDNSCDVGIITNKTIRINDVVHEAFGLVDILEIIEKYVKNLNGPAMRNTLENVSTLKSEKIKNAGNDFSKMKTDLSEKFESIKNKQFEITKKIDNFNYEVEKINKFIKK